MLSIALIRFEFNVTKWPPNDPKRTSSDLLWKHNFVTKSHFGDESFVSFLGCFRTYYVPFHIFWGEDGLITLIRFEFWATNELHLTSKWPQVTYSDLKAQLFNQHITCLWFLGMLSWLNLYYLSLESQKDFQMTSIDPNWPEYMKFLTNHTLGHICSKSRKK